MPRYFFHLRDSIAVHDHEGMELPSEADARLDTIRFGGTMLSNFPTHESWTVIVRDEQRAKIISLLFTAEPV